MRVAESVARWLITIGGIGTILAVATICIFLVWVVVPLFAGSSAQVRSEFPLRTADDVVALSADEYALIAIAVHRDGTVDAISLTDGRILETRKLVEGAKPTAVSFEPRHNALALGFADGSVQLGKAKIVSERVGVESLSSDVASELKSKVAVRGNAVYERLPDGVIRKQYLAVEMQKPVAVGSSAVLHVATGASAGRALLAVWRVDGTGVISEVRSKENMATGETTLKLESADLARPQGARTAPPSQLFITDLGDTVLVGWPDGYVVRHDTRDLSKPRIAEVFDITPRPTATLTAARWMIGTSTLVVGDSEGGLAGWFRIKPDFATTTDGGLMTRAHQLAPHPSSVTSLAVSRRNRLFAAGHVDGTVRVVNMTASNQVASLRVASGAIVALDIVPRNDKIVVLTKTGVATVDLHADSSEITAASILKPVWYEGYTKPEHVWQSSSGSDDFEAKFGLLPLIFGTLKATFYALLFAIPIALLAAIATSEFVNPRTKARVKPAIEMMASLPSVVLGFLGALVLAPIVEDHVPSILTALLLVPTLFVTAAHFWLLVPPARAMRLGPWARGIAMVSTLPLGIVVSSHIGPLAERFLFGGNFKSWLSVTLPTGASGEGPFGGWFILLMPFAAVTVVLFGSRIILPALSHQLATSSREKAARVAVVRHLLSVLATLALAAAMAWILSILGFDPRGGVMATYVQRNALVVGFVMGFAVIPIIYTLADDALSSVPQSLRSASLGCGATPWQTATRVVLPTAASGIFSAIMVGLGRAVGETMVVLMAAGNTPVLEWNVFNGFRTLSANIAVELPEAVEGHVHFRMLFLAALVLFAITFVLNTIAEVVRQRFRKRAYQL